MKRISMLKFRKICEEISPAEFSFSIRNQPVREFNSVELTSTYPKMSMMFNPNRICFRNEAGTICFNRVKAINYYEESQAFGMVFGIVCDNDPENGGEITYKIIVDKKRKM